MAEVKVLAFETFKTDAASETLTAYCQSGWEIHTVTGISAGRTYGTDYIVYTLIKPAFKMKDS